MRGNVDLGDMKAFYRALFSNHNGLSRGAFFEVGEESLSICVRNLVELCAQLPLPPRPFASTGGIGDSDYGVDRSVGQVDSHKQHASDFRQPSSREARTGRGEAHATL